MLRAAALGVVDFAQCDPWDSWWWRRTHLLLDEVGRRTNQEAMEAQHRHYLALVSNPRLEEESWDANKSAAYATLTGLLQSCFPWRAQEIGEAGTKTSREHAVSQFHELYGNPDEPRYKQMIAELSAYFAKGKLTQRQKDLERKKRRERTQAA